MCSSDLGRAIWVLGLLRVMAYNVTQLLRRKTLRKLAATGGSTTIPSFRKVFRWIEAAVCQPLLSIEPVPIHD